MGHKSKYQLRVVNKASCWMKTKGVWEYPITVVIWSRLVVRWKKNNLYTGRTSLRFEKEKRAGGWTLSVQKWIVRIYARLLIWIHHPLFWSKAWQRIKDQDSSDLWTGALGLSAENRAVSDRLRLAINVLDLAPALSFRWPFIFCTSYQFVCDQGCTSRISIAECRGWIVPRKVGSG